MKNIRNFSFDFEGTKIHEQRTYKYTSTNVSISHGELCSKTLIVLSMSELDLKQKEMTLPFRSSISADDLAALGMRMLEAAFYAREKDQELLFSRGKRMRQWMLDNNKKKTIVVEGDGGG